MQINGIQQLGVGVENVHDGFRWFRQNFGMDILVFDEKAVAELMLAHTDGKSRERHAILALNMQGGGGFEIWQHTGKKPVLPEFEIQLGDLGISVGKIKSVDVDKTYQQFKSKKLNLLTEVCKDPSGNKHFYVKDTFNNIWEFVEEQYIFSGTKAENGGIYGAVIGVKNIEESLKVYGDILGYDTVVYDKSGSFEDLKGLPGGDASMRRILLKSSRNANGAFSPLFGPSSLELMELKGTEGRDIFKGRIWGDPGFIHLCFDINGMDELRDIVIEHGFPFTVDSAAAMDTFDMGEAAGNFAYIQAPEGTLIEFVETHKVPLLKKVGWYLDLRKRKAGPLPNWILKMFALKRVRN